MNKLNKYEVTRVLSARSEQISFGAPPLIKILKDDTAYSLAEKELEKGIIPLAIIRTKNGKKEIISVS